MAHRHNMSDECALDKICCSLNGTQHCSARLPPLATPLVKDYRHRVLILLVSARKYIRAWTIDETDDRKINCPINDQSIITKKWSQLIDCHQLALKNLGIPHVPAVPLRICTRSTHKCLRFEFVHRIVCMQLHGFKNQLQKHTLKRCFEETQVKNTPFCLASFAVLYTVDIWLIWFLGILYFYFIFLLFPIFKTGPVHTLCKMKLLLPDLSV